MDSSDSETKRFSLEEISPFNSYHLSISITVLGIHRAVLENDLEAVKKVVEAGESVNVREEQCGYAPLHLAVIRDRAEILDYLLSRDDIEVDAQCYRILDYLLSRDDIEVDAQCYSGQSPLQIACDLGAYQSAKKLINAGADVNLSDYDGSSPLHQAARFPQICRLLLQNGANVDAVDRYGAAPLHHAINLEDLETMYMLLYYNADPDMIDDEGMTTITHAVVYHQVEVQRALLDYVVDFNAKHHCSSYSDTLLGVALQCDSPFILEIIDRGAEVNYGDRQSINEWTDDCAFTDCLYGMGEDGEVFKVVWERLRCYRKRKPVDLCKLFEYLPPSECTSVIKVIIESDNLELAVDSFTRNENFHLFARDFINSGLDVEQIVVLTYRLLEYGYRPTLEDVRVVFSDYGPCELTRVLRYMDVDCKGVYGREWKTYLRAVFDLDFEAAVLAGKIDSDECRLTSKELVSVLEYFRDPYLMNVLQSKYGESEIMREILNGVSKVPSLVELARNHARKYIRERFKVGNICQFYTIIDRLNIPSLCTKILTFSRKIYRVK